MYDDDCSGDDSFLEGSQQQSQPRTVRRFVAESNQLTRQHSSRNSDILIEAGQNQRITVSSCEKELNAASTDTYGWLPDPGSSQVVNSQRNFSAYRPTPARKELLLRNPQEKNVTQPKVATDLKEAKIPQGKAKAKLLNFLNDLQAKSNR